MPVNVAVIGCGYWGPNLIRNFSDLDDARVALVCDKDPARLERIQRRMPHVRVTTAVSEVIEDTGIDAISIATPVRTHFELASEALRHGKHVLVEKPITASSDDARRLIDLAAERRRVLMVGHTFEYHGAVNKIKELIDAGEIGEPLYLDSTRINLGLFQHDINVLWDLVPHDLSIAHYLLGQDPRHVSAVGMSHFGGLENVAYMTLMYDGKLIAHFNVNWLAPAKVRLMIIGGTRKMIIYDDLEPSEKVKVYDKGVDLQSEYGTMARVKVQYRTGDMHAPAYDTTEALRAEVQHFVDCIRTGARPRSDGESGLRVVSILEAASKSIAEGGRKIEIK